MFTQNEYVSLQLNRDAYDSAFQEAEKLRKLQSAGLLRTSRLPDIAVRSAGTLGRLLMALGQRLVGVEKRSAMTSSRSLKAV